MSNKHEDPAFPLPEVWATGDQYAVAPAFLGLTKREWFAGQALAGLCSIDYKLAVPSDVVKLACDYADLMVERMRG